MLMTHSSRADRAPTSANDPAALQNEQVMDLPNESYTNPLREARHRQEKSKGTTGFTNAVREPYLSHIFLTAKQLCCEV